MPTPKILCKSVIYFLSIFCKSSDIGRWVDPFNAGFFLGVIKSLFREYLDLYQLIYCVCMCIDVYIMKIWVYTMSYTSAVTKQYILKEN